MKSTADDYRSLAAQGFTAKEAAKIRGHLRQAATAAAKRGGFRFLTEKEATLQRAKALAAEGLTAPQAAKRLGRTRGHLYRLAEAHGFSFRGNNRRRLAAMPQDQRDDYRRCIRARFPAVEALAMVERRRDVQPAKGAL